VDDIRLPKARTDLDEKMLVQVVQQALTGRLRIEIGRRRVPEVIGELEGDGQSVVQLGGGSRDGGCIAAKVPRRLAGAHRLVETDERRLASQISILVEQCVPLLFQRPVFLPKLLDLGLEMRHLRLDHRGRHVLFISHNVAYTNVPPAQTLCAHRSDERKHGRGPGHDPFGPSRLSRLS